MHVTRVVTLSGLVYWALYRSGQFGNPIAMLTEQEMWDIVNEHRTQENAQSSGR